MSEFKKSWPKRKAIKGHKKTEPPIDYEYIYYNDFWSNKKEYNKIENGLYLGSDIPIKDNRLMETLNVTHILSIKEESVPEEERSHHIMYHHLEAGDFPDQDLISSFDFCFKIIESAQKSREVVFVNCGGGVSRSATIVIAYIMQKNRLSVSEALKRVSKKRKVFPNEGFIDQLNLFERMQWFIDGSNEEYRRFLLKSLTYQLRSYSLISSGRIDKIVEREMRFNYEKECVRDYFEKMATAESLAKVNGRSLERGSTIHCYFCNNELFNEFNVIGRKEMNSHCNHIFIEPLQTYCTQPDTYTNGFLKCPSCLNTFGTYNWLLYDCNCTFHHKDKECLALKVFPHRISY